MFRRQRIVEADHAAAYLGSVLTHQPVMGVDAEERPTPAMEVNQRALTRTGGRDMHTHAQAFLSNAQGFAERHLRPASRPGCANLFGDLTPAHHTHSFAPRQRERLGIDLVDKEPDAGFDIAGLGLGGMGHVVCSCQGAAGAWPGRR